MNTHEILRDLVARVKCKWGWTFRLQTDMVNADMFPKLVITVSGFDSARPDELLPMAISHYFPVPEATYNEATWRRWMFECCRGVENHELGEWFRDGDERPFAPLHGPGENPYVVHEFRPLTDALTTQDGSMRAPYKEPGLAEAGSRTAYD